MASPKGNDCLPESQQVNSSLVEKVETSFSPLKVSGGIFLDAQGQLTLLSVDQAKIRIHPKYAFPHLQFLKDHINSKQEEVETLIFSLPKPKAHKVSL